MTHYRCIVSYDGSGFVGWQENGTGPSVQGALEQVLSQVTQHPVRVEGASRTDRGVHAEGQVAAFSLDSPIDSLKLQSSFNALLPDAIRVTQVQTADSEFHPTLDAVSKTYLYRIYTGPVCPPLQRHMLWHVPDILDWKQMQAACELLAGRHDFQAFCNMRKDLRYDTTVRDVSRLELQRDGDLLCVWVEAHSFMYKMVRNLVGSIVDVGRGKLELAALEQVLESGDRTRAGVTAPAHGLTLMMVKYD